MPLLLFLCAAAAPGPWDHDVAALSTASNDSWHAIVDPAAHMAKLAYTSTWGAYYTHWDKNKTVPGWERDMQLNANPPEGGMRAIFFSPL